jgi:peptidoglycan hydrolase CwlO-like protein
MITNNKTKYFFLATFAICHLLFTNNASAVDCGDLNGDAKKECEDLEKKAKVYENLINLKNKQQDTLAAQMDAIDRDQAKTKSDFLKTQEESENLSDQIESLERQIQEKTREADIQKKILKSLMQAYYEYDRQGILELVISSDDMSDFLGDSDRIEQSGLKVKNILSDLQKNRAELLTDRKEIQEKKDEQEKKKAELADKKSELDATESQKQSLLAQTEGEEQKYKELLQRVEEQKKDLFNFSEASNVDEILNSVKDYPAPKSNLASTSWYFSQRDSRWGSKKIGNSSSLMKDYGCAITCVAMVFRKNGVGIDPGKLAKEKIFYYDLINWPRSWPPGIALTSSISHGNISWSTIDKKIKSGTPVIVYIKKTNSRGGHYVLVTGKDSKDYIVHDPYFGSNLYLGTSKSLVGKIGVDSKVVVDQMIVYE